MDRKAHVVESVDEMPRTALAPLVRLVDEPVAAYHLVIALNAVLATSVAPLLYLLLRRTGMNHWYT